MIDRPIDTPEQTARKAHKGEKRNWWEDYINHIERVVSHMDTDTERSVARLHDVLEKKDIEMFKLNIMKIYWPEIYVPLLAITHREQEPYKDYIHRVTKSQVAIKVKIRDMYDNLNDSPSPNARQKYLTWLPYLLQFYEWWDIEIDLWLLI